MILYLMMKKILKELEKEKKQLVEEKIKLNVLSRGIWKYGKIIF